MKKHINKIIYLIFLFLMIIFCYLFNSKYDILALFIDDLNSFMYFPNNNIFEYALKFYPEATHYRPFYEIFQYIAFFIAGHNPHILFLINIVFNGVIAFYIFYKCNDLFKNGLASFAVGILYLLSHFSCYQINQATGLMESIATLLALIVLFNLLKLVDDFSIKNIIKIIIGYFCIILTHERYFSLFIPILLSAIMIYMIHRNNNKGKNQSNNNLLKKVFMFISGIVIVVLFVVFIRFMALNKILPAGTSGTRVEDTFTIAGLIDYIVKQFKFIIGINTGDESSSGITYTMLGTSLRTLIQVQIVFLFVFVIVYLIVKISNIKRLINENSDYVIEVIKYIYIDVIFILFVLSCIVFSSVTVMLEIRFIYISFIVMCIYFVYCFSYIKSVFYERKIMVYIFMSLLILFVFLFRSVVEYRYRRGNDNIYYMIDQRRLNNFAKETVCKYGNDIVDKKNICILGNTYMYTLRYSDNLLQIYQKDYEKKPIQFISNIEDLKKLNIDKEDTLILAEDRSRDSYYIVNNYQ